MFYPSEVSLLLNIFYILFCVLEESGTISTAVTGNENFAEDVDISHLFIFF